MAATLEQKYIELLEQKIAVLQESLADQKKDSTVSLLNVFLPGYYAVTYTS